ncbi:c-type cytochrome [Sphingomonas sp. NFX23]|uniref:c-type cytochrome n=1 Tax=Sphingomonas sp. NFX23 TaxID=2819532 RepID=UPI003CFAAED2
MTHRVRTGIVSLAVAAALFLTVVAVSWYNVEAHPVASTAITAPVPFALLNEPIPDGPNAGLLRKGRYLVTAGDCVSCHTSDKGAPFAGGLGLQTPFGTIYSPNMTGDKVAGIGNWTPDQFFKAITRGVGPHERMLYPALPYTYMANVTRADSDAMLAYLKTVPASSYVAPPNKMPFPFGIRQSLVFWNLLFRASPGFSPQPDKSAAWNRGRYLVDGLGHCGACHTPKNLLGADVKSKYLAGGDLESWIAPDLTSNVRTGLGSWSAADIATYLKTGRNSHANAGGPMAEVVSFSMSQMTDADLSAIATYLKSVPASPAANPGVADQGSMRRGAAIYSDACAACHLSNGRAQPGYIPPLPGSASTQQANATGVVRVILGGARTGPTATRPSALAMPSFAWKLTDRQVADVATFVRNSWGNRASPVDEAKVKHIRKTLKLTEPLRTR